jgi:hypothetical protein
MHGRDATYILERLIDVTQQSRDAFTEAAFAVRAPRLSSLFIRRAQHHAQHVEFLRARLEVGIRSPAVPRYPSPSIVAGAKRFPRGPRSHPAAYEPAALLGACIRSLDTSIQELRRAYGPALTLPQRLSLDRHQDQMRWAREELMEMLRTHRSPRPVSSVATAPRARAASDAWFGLQGRARPLDGVTPLAPDERVHHHLQMTSGDDG